jgi:hypothetical protein
MLNFKDGKEKVRSGGGITKITNQPSVYQIFNEKLPRVEGWHRSSSLAAGDFYQK